MTSSHLIMLLSATMIYTNTKITTATSYQATTCSFISAANIRSVRQSSITSRTNFVELQPIPTTSQMTVLLATKKKGGGGGSVSKKKLSRKRRGKKQQRVGGSFGIVGGSDSLKDEPAIDDWSTSSDLKKKDTKGKENAVAKKLIESQRQSTSVLGHIKDKIEEKVAVLDDNEIGTLFDKFIINSSSNVNEKDLPHYVSIENFLGKGDRETPTPQPNDNTNVAQEMLAECIVMMNNDNFEENSNINDNIDLKGENSTSLNKPERIVTRTAGGLTSGMYRVPISGGAAQYKICPRIIEFVVSMTKNLPPALLERQQQQQNDDAVVSDKGSDGGNGREERSSKDKLYLSTSKCQASLLIFDRRTRDSSMRLLYGDKAPPTLTSLGSFGYSTKRDGLFDDNLDDNDDDDDKDSSLMLNKRKITIMYNIVPESWLKKNDETGQEDDEHYGGGITIRRNSKKRNELLMDVENNDNSYDDTKITAKNDRLVLLRSDLCLHRVESWVGACYDKTNEKDGEFRKEQSIPDGEDTIKDNVIEKGSGNVSGSSDCGDNIAGCIVLHLVKDE